MKLKILVICCSLVAMMAAVSPLPAVAADSSSQSLQVLPQDPEANKFFGAAIAFTASALGAGWAISRAGSAGLAAAAERPELRTLAIIITALGEAIAIYGIVIAILILGG